MHNVILITTTYYPKPGSLRERLAKETVAAAHAAGYRVVIVDDSKRPDLIEEFTTLGAEACEQKFSGMGTARRQAFFAAWSMAVGHTMKNPIFLWLEPEKVDVVRLVPELIARIVSDESDIVVMRRSDASFATYPTFQVTSEQQANAVYAEATGLKGFDPMSGPVAWNSLAMPFFIAADGKRWGVRDGYVQHFAPLEAKVSGCAITSVGVDFRYPPEQRAEEEGAANEAMLEKRRQQLDDLSTAYRTIATQLRLRDAA